MNHSKLLKNSQYGFRENHSTEYAAMEFVDNTSKIMDDGMIPFSVFIDLSKAFDTLDHNILMKKLHYYGIQDTCLNWFRSYLTNRTQYTIFKDSQSIPLTIKTGVPQGSVLGPSYSLFTLMIYHKHLEHYMQYYLLMTQASRAQ